MCMIECVLFQKINSWRAILTISIGPRSHNRRLPNEIPVKSSHLVPPLALHSVGHVSVSIEAARHLEGLDVLSRAHSTGALSDDARQTHLLLHVDLLLTGQALITALTARPRHFKAVLSLTSIQGFLSWAADVQALTMPWLLSRANSGPQRWSPRTP